MTHPMTSPTHYCVVCGARWRQNDDFSMSLRDQQCCDACNNAPVGGQLMPLSTPAYVAMGRLRVLVAACNRLAAEAEEYHTDDGAGRWAHLDYWHEFDGALEDAQIALAQEDSRGQR